MKKYTIQQLADQIIELTGEYMEVLRENASKPVEDQVLIAFYCGFVAGMKMNGYAEKELAEAVLIARAGLEHCIEAFKYSDKAN
jgi:hypothetical protein